MAPGLALADAVLALPEEEAPAPMPFQLPAASASAEIEAPALPGLSLLLLLLSGLLVAGTLSSLFRSCAQRDHHHAHPVHTHRWYL